MRGLGCKYEVIVSGADGAVIHEDVAFSVTEAKKIAASLVVTLGAARADAFLYGEKVLSEYPVAPKKAA